MISLEEEMALDAECERAELAIVAALAPFSLAARRRAIVRVLRLVLVDEGQAVPKTASRVGRFMAAAKEIGVFDARQMSHRMFRSDDKASMKITNSMCQTCVQTGRLTRVSRGWYKATPAVNVLHHAESLS